ncbi:MAG: TniQ family protein [Afipia sp.]|nr:TniQ family protein [Afipia sp.]
MTKTPLPLWFPPAKDEPAHGILFRLAERNGIEKFARVPALTGLKVAQLRVGNGADRLASIIRCDPAAFMNSTLIAESRGKVLIRGERLDTIYDLTRISRRLCPGCVADSAHHRFWWDLKFVTTCPEHYMKLVDVCSCGEKLSWKDVRIAKCRHCENGNVASLPKTRANHDVQTMDKWVLARLGIGQSGPVPILDKMSLTHALDTMGRIGALDFGGYRKNWVQPRDFEIPEAEVRARGFRILHESRLDAVLDKVYEEFMRSKPSATASVHSAYGWFGRWFTSRKSENFSKGIAEIIIANASRKFQVQRGTFPTLVRQAPTSLTLTEASRNIGVRRETLRDLLEIDGKVRKEKRRGSPVAIANDDVARIARDYVSAVSLRQLAPLLGVGTCSTRMLHNAKEVPEWILGGKFGEKRRYRFRQADIAKWVDDLIGEVPMIESAPNDGILLAETPFRKIFPIVALVQAIRDRRITVIGRLNGKPKFGGAILRTADVEASVPAEIKKKLGSQRRGLRGPYGPQKKNPRRRAVV